jgi:hypothetical protein
MKKLHILPLLLALTLLATACGAAPQVPVPDSVDRVAMAEGETALTGTVETDAGRWDYEITVYTVTGEHCAPDDADRVLVRHSYQLPRMSVSGFQGKKPTQVREAAEQVAADFNDWFDQRLRQAVSWFDEMAAAAEEDYRYTGKEEGSFWRESAFGYSDAVTQEFWTNGTLLCVTATESSFSGGAHGIVLKSAASFDLRTGDQVTAADLTDDPEGLRQAVKEELARQALRRQAPEDDEYAAGKVAFFDDWEETLDDWMERTVTFGDEGMQVIFGVYDIAPFVYGDQVFTIPYDLLAPELNAGGRALLGVK